jgi:trypsin
MLKRSYVAVSVFTALTALSGTTPALAESVKLLNSNLPDVKIVGGTEAPAHSLPYQVSIQGLNGSHFCGGSIIGEDVVLTAAHCVEGMAANPSIQVHVGAHNVSQSVGERIRVANVYSHKEYPGLSKDVAVLKLASKITDKNAKPVKLADQAFMATHLKPGVSMKVSGWGTLESGGSLPDKLMQVDVPYVTNAVCNMPESYNGQVQETELCGGFKQGGKDSCQGDSGGPLVIKQEGEFVQVGVVSWGEGCAAPNKYGVYANVAALNTWITDAAAGNEQPGGGTGGGGEPTDDGGDDTQTPDSSETTYFAIQVTQSWTQGEDELEFTFDIPEGVNLFYVATRGDNGELDLEIQRVEDEQSDNPEGEELPEDDWGWEWFDNGYYFSANPGSNESIVIEYPTAGQYKITVPASEDFKDVEFTIMSH